MSSVHLHLRGFSDPHGPRASRAARGLVLLAFVVTLLAAPGLLAGCGDEGDDDGVALRVNGSPVTEEQVETVRADARLSGSADDRETALEEAIRRELVRQEATRLGVSVAKDDLDERLAQVEERAGGAESLAGYLEQAGMSRAQLRAAAEYGLLRESLGDAKYPDLTASEKQTADFYRRHRDDIFTEPASANLLSIQVPTEKLAEDVLAELREGSSFEHAARKYSRDPEAKANGGRLGWVLESTLPAPLAAAVAALEVGETSQPVDGGAGWYVLRLLDRREQSVAPYAEVRGELRDQITGRMRLKELDAWLEQTRSEATVERIAG